jgi:pimeloyl-ACP methyl ester carboxylesterase
VEPLFFGVADRSLFGIYHPPKGLPQEDGVVICPPLFAEYLRVHGSLRRLAIRLAESGRHVFRFDYYGTGDSSGEFETTTPDDWLADIGAAVTELRAISGVRRVRLVGVRLGATLAARAALDMPSVDRLVLWDPIVAGAAYARQLRETHKNLLRAHGASLELGGQPLDTEHELVGFSVSPRMISAIEGLTLPTWAELLARPNISAAIVLSEENLGYDAMIAEAQRKDVLVERVDFHCNWTANTQAVLYSHDIESNLVGKLQ